MKTPDKENQKQAPAMPFNEALKRVWAAPPMPKVKPKLEQAVLPPLTVCGGLVAPYKVKPKPAAKPAQTKPAK
jgi:hypothetical protein